MGGPRIIIIRCASSARSSFRSELRYVSPGQTTIDIGILLTGHALYRPDCPALKVGGSQFTFAELYRQVNKLANALLAAGLTKGDKVSTIMTNRLELVLIYWAAAKTGLVIVPISTLLQEAGLKSLLKDSNSAMIFADASFIDV